MSTVHSTRKFSAILLKAKEKKVLRISSDTPEEQRQRAPMPYVPGSRRESAAGETCRKEEASTGNFG
jgi:hypothetical protein